MNAFLLSLKLNPEKSFDPKNYPFSIPVIRNLTSLEFDERITFFVGENGSGKSTILEALALHFRFNPEGGSKNFLFKSSDTHSSLNQYLRVAKGVRRPRDGYFLRAESFYNLSTEIDAIEAKEAGLIDAYGGTSLHQQSHGESFMSLLQHRFKGNGLYLLDEPEAALSPTRQMAMLARIHQLIEANSQFVIATHSPILLAYPSAKIVSFDDGKLKEICYQETEHYYVMKSFLNNTDKMLDELFLEKV